MKISIAWVFDHIDTSSLNGGWQSLNIIDLINRFNQTTAETEKFQKVSVNLDALRMAQVQTITNSTCSVRDEIGTMHTLPIRNNLEIGQWYLITITNSAAWTIMQDIGSSRDTLMPALALSESDIKNWKQHCERDDYIIDIDNKSITHRPDMWGHRGIAREIAAILRLPLKPFKNFLAPAEIAAYDQQSPNQDINNPWMIAINTQKGCSRFATQYIDNINYKPSLLWMAHRLARVDARAIDAIVDATNYVMLDIGQPMHAFDAATLAGDTLTVRTAQQGEELQILDGQKITLTPHDMVVADAEKAVALAGIMGGSYTGVNVATRSLILESACFDATTIRHSSARHKIRTEASARFEKTLDPNQNVYAIRRFIKLLHDVVLPKDVSSPIISLGGLATPDTITIAHKLIEQRLGVSLKPDFVLDILRRLDFEIEDNAGMYLITVPTFRATKDIGIQEDIIEEIGRYFGYSTIPDELPRIESKAHDLTAINRLRMIKQFLAYGCAMRELYNYALYDESFLRTINWQPGKTLTVTDPVSENWQRLVTSLIPNLLKAIAHNAAEHDQLRFFEYSRIWDLTASHPEQKKLAGIIFDKKNSVDFYDAKAYLERLFAMLNLHVSWAKVDTPDQPWFAPYQTAHLMHNDICVGIAGKVNPAFFGTIAEGDAFMFELNADFLTEGAMTTRKYQPVSKYPDVVRDVSLFMPLTTSVDTILTSLQDVDPHIVSVTLIDFFEKVEWHDKKALAFRCVLRDKNKTMTKEEVDLIWDKVLHILAEQGATIR